MGAILAGRGDFAVNLILGLQIHIFAATFECAVGKCTLGFVSATLFALSDHFEFEPTIFAHVYLTQFHFVTACHFIFLSSSQSIWCVQDSSLFSRQGQVCLCL
jgi:hypothetical protein